MSKRVKIFAIVIIALALLVWIFSSMGGKTPQAPDTGLSSSLGAIGPSPVAGQSGGSEFATLLSSVKSITIDDSIFANPAFKALRDHPINVGTDVVGRSNPFAPVGTDGADLSSAPIVQTLQPGKITSTSAELSAQVAFTTTAPVTLVFQYGPTDQFGTVTAPQTLTKSGTGVVTISGLTPSTTYHVQAVAVVGSTTTNGNTMTFTTTTAPATR